MQNEAPLEVLLRVAKDDAQALEHAGLMMSAYEKETSMLLRRAGSLVKLLAERLVKANERAGAPVAASGAD